MPHSLTIPSPHPSPWKDVCCVPIRSGVSDSLQPHGPQPTRLLCPWDSPGKNTGWVAISSPADLPNPGIKPRSPTLQVDSLQNLPREALGRVIIKQNYLYYIQSQINKSKARI